MIKITTLIENHENPEKGLTGEHGLSMLIETDTQRILFDTGQTGEFLLNAALLQADLNGLNAIVLSHGHYDHTGGILKYLGQKIQEETQIYVGKGFFEKKYKRLEDGTYRYNGNPFTKDRLQDAGANIHEVSLQVSPLSERLILLHGFLSVHPFEEPAEEFYKMQEGVYCRDDFSDELALAILTEKGFFLVAGCAHPGILGMAEQAVNRLGQPLRGVIGGSHLIHAGEGRLMATAAGLKRLNPDILALSHCTGEEGMKRLKEVFGDRFYSNISGSEFIFD